MKKLILTVRDEKVAVIVQTIIGEIESFTMETIETEPRQKGRIHRVRHQKKDSNGRSAPDIVLDLARSRQDFSKSDTGKALKQAGFAATTASPTLTMLIRAGKIAKIGYGLYKAL